MITVRRVLFVALLCMAHYRGWAADGPPSPGLTSLGSPAAIDASTGNTVFKGIPYDEYLFDFALTADMLQSLEIHKTNYIETNALLGGHPSEAKIVGYFVGVGIVHYLMTFEMVREHVPTAFVHSWEAGTIGLEMAYVKHNASLGVHFYVP